MPYRSDRLAREARTARVSRRAQPHPVTPPVGRAKLGLALLAVGVASGAALLGLGLPAPREPTPRLGSSRPRVDVSSTWAAPAATEPTSSLGALGGLGLWPSSLSHMLQSQGMGGFVPLDIADSTRTARVVSDTLFAMSAATACNVRFASDRDGCSAEIRCGARSLYLSGEHGLACVRSVASETAAWDADARFSFSFAPDAVRMFDTSSRSEAPRTLVLELDPPRVPTT